MGASLYVNLKPTVSVSNALPLLTSGGVMGLIRTNQEENMASVCPDYNTTTSFGS